MFRHYPDALERATELDAQYGSNSPLDEMPMYGIVFSFKDPFDTKDVRTTASGDATDHGAGVEAVLPRRRRLDEAAHDVGGQEPGRGADSGADGAPSTGAGARVDGLK